MTGFKDGTVRHIRRAKMEATFTEDEWFDAYIELGSIAKTLEHFGFKKTDTRTLYDWLHELHTDSQSGRWERWQEVKTLRAHLEFDEVNDLAEDIDSTNVNRRREQIKAKQWRVEKLAPAEYGKQDQRINVAIGTPDQWLNALATAHSHQLPQTPRDTEQHKVAQAQGGSGFLPPPDSEEGAG